MSGRTSLCLLSAAIAFSSFATLSSDARACGGCFTGGGQPTLVSGHRMALSVSVERTVLWDQIQYQGDPEEFAWVLPVKPGTRVDLASDAFFEALDAATSTNVSPPPNLCNNFDDDWGDDGFGEGEGSFPDPSPFNCAISGCAAEGAGLMVDMDSTTGGEVGGGDEPPEVPPVEVVHQESIGPYESVILSSNQPGALYDWLLSHGYAVDPTMEPVIDDYEAQGFDFVGLRLIPGVGTSQMTPVRVTSPGAAPVLPLRMVAAGTGANVAMTLFVLGEGRWEAGEPFNNEVVDPSFVTWDFANSRSNYSDLRLRTLGRHFGATWMTTYAKVGALLAPVLNPVSMSGTIYRATNGSTTFNIAELYAQQGIANGENVDLKCTYAFQQNAGSLNKVVDPCEPAAAGGTGGTGGGGGAGGEATSSSSSGTGAGAGAGSGGAGAMAGAGGNGGSGAGGSGAGGSGGAMAGAGGTGGAMAGAGGSGGAMAGAGGSGGAMTGAGGAMTTSGTGAMTGAGGSGTGGTGAGGSEQVCTGEIGPGEIDARVFACGDLDDISVALVGMRPQQVWVTRLEALLPKSALASDLPLQATAFQSPVENWVFAAQHTGDPCAFGGAAPPPEARKDEPRRRPPFGNGDLIAMSLTAAALLTAAARRYRRPAVRRIA